MSEEQEQLEVRQEAARTELRSYLEGLIRQFDNGGRRGPERATVLEPSDEPDDSDVVGPSPSAPPFGSQVAATSRFPPVGDSVVSAQLQVRDEIRALREDLQAHHRELLDALENLSPVTGRVAGPAGEELRSQSLPESVRSEPVDEYQTELIEDLDRATRRLLNWYIALASELSTVRRSS